MVMGDDPYMNSVLASVINRDIIGYADRQMDPVVRIVRRVMEEKARIEHYAELAAFLKVEAPELLEKYNTWKACCDRIAAAQKEITG